MGQECFDDPVHRIAGAHHEKQLARALQALDQFFYITCAYDRRPFRRSGQEGVGGVCCAVVDHHSEAVVVHVQGQVLAHDRKADQPDVRLCHIFPLSPSDPEYGIIRLLRNRVG